jgi:hypothetical protein
MRGQKWQIAEPSQKISYPRLFICVHVRSSAARSSSFDRTGISALERPPADERRINADE